MKKQTAANNQELRELKAMANEKVFKNASKILNEQGRDEMIAFLTTIDTTAFGFSK